MPMFVQTIIEKFTIPSGVTNYVYEIPTPQRGDLVRFSIAQTSGSRAANITADLLWGAPSQPVNSPNAAVFSDIPTDMLKMASATISATNQVFGGYLNPIIPYANPSRGRADIRTQADLGDRLYLKLSSTGNFSGDFVVLLVIRSEYA